MKRWGVLLGRSGTTILAVGLALFLVTFIPPVPIGSFLGNGYVSKTWQTYYEGVLTPQQRIRVTVTANGTLNAYILEVSSRVIYNWINEHYSGAVDIANVTYFDQFLNSNPATIVWQGEISKGTIDYEYSPTKIVNVTLAVSDHSSDVVSADYTGSLLRAMAPASKVQILSEFAIPIGVALALPWINSLLRDRKRLER